MTTDENLRYLLRAFEDTAPCRLAALIVDTGETNRDALRAAWAQRYPRHAGQRGRKSIRARVGRAITLLKVAGVVTVDDTTVHVLNRAELEMAARNLDLLQTPDGTSLPPREWPRRPEAPERLRPVQDIRERGRTMAIGPTVDGIRGHRVDTPADAALRDALGVGEPITRADAQRLTAELGMPEPETLGGASGDVDVCPPHDPDCTCFECAGRVHHHLG